MSSNRKRSSKNIGSDSPASGSAREQAMSGHSGGPQGEQTRGVGRQPPQTSGRRPAAHEHLPEETKSLSPQEDPNEQGEPHHSAESIKQSSAMQGLAGGKGTASGARSDDVEETSQGGEPRSEHARNGREHTRDKK